MAENSQSSFILIAKEKYFCRNKPFPHKNTELMKNFHLTDRKVIEFKNIKFNFYVKMSYM